MAYQQTNATSVENLVNAIAAFAVSAGWTQRRNDLTGTNRTVTLQKGGDNIHLYNTDTSNIGLAASVGYDAGLGPRAQPNQSLYNARCNVGTGPFANVFMFAGDSPAEHVHVVIEVASGEFRMLSFGLLEKFGTYTGGTFFDASYINSSFIANAADSRHHRLFDNGTQTSSQVATGGTGGVRCDVDGNTNCFCPFADGSLATIPMASGGFISENPWTGGDGGYRNSQFFAKSVNSFGGVTPVAPVLIRVERPDNYWSDIGHVPGIRFLNMAKFASGDEFSLGPDTFKVFPWTSKTYYNYAFAFLKTA